jgi:hypothetical protein
VLFYSESGFCFRPQVKGLLSLANSTELVPISGHQNQNTAGCINQRQHKPSATVTTNIEKRQSLTEDGDRFQFPKRCIKWKNAIIDNVRKVNNCINITCEWRKNYILNWSIHLSSSFNVFYESFGIFYKCKFRVHSTYIVNMTVRVQFSSLSQSATEHSLYRNIYRNISLLSVICFQRANFINMKRIQSRKDYFESLLHEQKYFLTLTALKVTVFMYFTIKLHESHAIHSKVPYHPYPLLVPKLAGGRST